ncbi:hypothetical protein [Aeromonas salmonicida]|uniref:hypothetical protein n=1 Tax=Aeromonas salmonicida TaxID=645 RepID=UPI003D31441F
MSKHHHQFLAVKAGSPPRNLNDSIRGVMNASAGFKQSWLSGEELDAYETSQEAFHHLDYIQNELLRQRDAYKRNTSVWIKSPFKTSLDTP